MFDFIFRGLGTVLRFFSNLFGGNFLGGLFIFAIILNLVTLPFSIKQQHTSIRQAKMRPREMAIRKKYAGRNDRATQQKMQQEIMEMYQQQGYNPMGGCFPMLLQMAVLLLLFQVIINPLRYVVGMENKAADAYKAFVTAKQEEGGLGENISGGYQEINVIRIMNSYKGDEDVLVKFEEFCENYEVIQNEGKENETVSHPYRDGASSYVKELERVSDSKINFNLFGIQDFLAKQPKIGDLFKKWTTDVVLILIPLLNFVAQFFTMKLQKKFQFQPLQGDQQKQMGCMGKVMDWVFPALTLFIAFSVPAAIGIYWLFNNLLGVLRSFILHKAMPLPVFTEEDYKAAERELRGKGGNEKLVKTPDGVRSNPNSLHTIDFEEEDYAVLPDYESIYDKSAEEREQAKADMKPSKKGEPNKNIEAAPIKKDGKEDKKD